jgi:hypothetical protein
MSVRHEFSTSRPREGGDPYAVCSRFGNVADTLLELGGQGLWVPAFAGTTRGEIVSISNRKHS